MSQIGSTPVSFKSPEGWGGMTTLNKSAPFMFDLLEDCYVSSDGSEIRHTPGLVCALDPASTARSAVADTTTGYVITHKDARRPVRSLVAGPYYKEDIAPTADLSIWTRPTQLHCVEQVHGRWVFVGSSDLRREPICEAAGAPNTNWVRVISYDDSGAGTTVDLTLNANGRVTADTFNSIQVGDRIYLEGLTGTLATLLNDKGHNVTAVAMPVVTIGTNPGGTITAVTGQAGLISRVTNPNLASGTGQSDDVESLTIWTSLARGDVATPTSLVYPAHVANRMRDFGDPTTGAQTGNLKEGNANAATVNGGRSRRRQRALPFRVNPHVAGDRLILAAPGYGCVFQCPQVTPTNLDNLTEVNGLNSITNEVYDRPRALGVPKCVMWEDPDKAVATSYHISSVAGASVAWGGTDPSVAGRDGVYKFKFAYRDDATGEVGLCSEEIALTTTLTTYAFMGVRFAIYLPGYLLHEALALSVNVYRTERNGSTFYFDRNVSLDGGSTPGGGIVSSKYGLDPYAVTTEYFHHLLVGLYYSTDAVLRARVGSVPETIEQMPMGCKAARTVRGWTVFGGALGNSGSKRELQQGTLTYQFDRNSLATDGVFYEPDEIGSTFTNDYAAPARASFEGAETGFGCAGRSIPPAYSGQKIVSKTLCPFPRKELVLNKLVNTKVGYVGAAPGDWSGRVQDVRYEITDSPLVEASDLTDADMRIQTAYLKLPRGKLQISEADNPNIVPAANTTVLADELDEDVEGIGSMGGQVVACTRSKTYMIGFSQSPVGVPAEIASDRFGCIAANSMVEFDGGCAWLSDRGPVAMVGGVPTWIGKELERLFIGETSRYLRDSEGMMRHAWACNDAERGLIYFGVFANRFAGVTGEATVSYRGTTYTWATAAAHADRDQIQSLFACDEVLIYSYRVGAWSVWRPPASFGFQWMTRGQDATGNSRVFVLGSDKRLYALDDTYGYGSRDCFVSSLSQTGTFTTVNVSVASQNISRVGLTAVVYDTIGDKSILRGVRTVTADTGSTITFDSAITVESGDILLIGARSMRLRTTFVNLKGTQTQHAGRVGLRYDLWSRIAAGLGGDVVQNAWATATANTVTREGGVMQAHSEPLTRGDEASDPDYRWLGRSYPNSPEYTDALDRGLATGATHQIDMTVVGGAQLRLHDLTVEMA